MARRSRQTKLSTLAQQRALVRACVPARVFVQLPIYTIYIPYIYICFCSLACNRCCNEMSFSSTQHTTYRFSSNSSSKQTDDPNQNRPSFGPPFPPIHCLELPRKSPRALNITTPKNTTQWSWLELLVLHQQQQQTGIM